MKHLAKNLCTFMVSVILVFLGLNGIKIQIGGHKAYGKCVNAECNRSTQAYKYQGGGYKLKKPIKVNVCHTYWNRLNIGYVDGYPSKWYRMRMYYRAGGSDLLSVVRSRCKTYFVQPGTKIGGYASCVKRRIYTPKMYTSGVYYIS